MIDANIETLTTRIFVREPKGEGMHLSMWVPPQPLDSCTKLSPPVPYGPEWSGRWSQGSIDNGSIIDAATLIHNDSLKALNDFQAFLLLVHCNQVLTGSKIDLITSRVTWQGKEAAPPAKCSRGIANPSYIRSVARAKTDGTADIGRIVNTLSRAFMRLEEYLDDIQVRIEQTHCQQSSSIARLSILMKQRQLKDGIRQPFSPSVKNMKKAIQSSANSQGSSLPNRPARRLKLTSCKKILPQPSFVRTHQRWHGAPGDPESVKHVWIMDTIRLGSVDIEKAQDDLYIRLERLRCEQLNINARLQYLTEGQ